jgi:hypothetical protein
MIPRYAAPDPVDEVEYCNCPEFPVEHTTGWHGRFVPTPNIPGATR